MKKNHKDEKLTNAVPDESEKMETTSASDKADGESSAKKKTPRKNIFKSKKFKYGGFSVIVSIIFIVAIILVNVVTTLAADKFNVKADLTENKLYSVEDSTKDYIMGLKDDKVTITITSPEETLKSGYIYYSQTNEIVKLIASLNDNITLNYVDLVTNPSFASKFSSETIREYQIIIQSEKTGRYKVLTDADYLNVTYNAYYTAIESVEGNAEQAVTSAIMSVTDVDPVKVAVITGYNETVNASFQNLLETNAYILESVNITLTDKISPDYDIVFIFGATADYSNADITKLETWLDNGGKFNKDLVYFASTAMGSSPNLDAFLAEWGIKVEKGTIYQTNTDYAYETDPLLQQVSIMDSAYADTVNNSFVVFANNIVPVTAMWEGSGNIETKVLAESFDGAYIRPSDAADSWKPSGADGKGKWAFAVDSSKVMYEGTEESSSHIVAIGSMEMLSNSYLFSSQLQNSQFIMNIFNTLCGKNEGITLTPKTFEFTPFDITAAQSNILAVIFIGIVPVGIVVGGIVIWVRRKHR